MTLFLGTSLLVLAAILLIQPADTPRDITGIGLLLTGMYLLNRRLKETR